MLKALSLTQLAEAVQGQLHLPEQTEFNAECQIQNAVTDSRAIKPHCVFFALVGEKFDAHDFLNEVAHNEAVLALVVERPPESATTPYVVVDDTTQAYGHLASWLRLQWSHPVAAITGSCGKTTVKTLLASICQQQGETLATQGNFNNHIGVPHTLLSLRPHHQYAVIEMGASGLGEIAYLAHLASPQVALVNNAMPAHVEGFGSLAAIVQEKGQIYSALQQDGVAVLNLDDPHVDDWRKMIGDQKCLGFSMSGNPTADVWAENIQLNAQGCAQFLMHTPEGSRDISLQVMGRHNVANALAATACALPLGIQLDCVVAGLHRAESAPGRLELLRVNDTLNLINDAYNANPGSVKVGIDCLVEQSGWRCLVLGDMAELGEEAAEGHSDVGVYAASKGVDAIFLYGEHAKDTQKGVQSVSLDHEVWVESFATHKLLSNRLLCMIAEKTAGSSEGVSVLIKGSRSAHMESVTEMLLSRVE